MLAVIAASGLALGAMPGVANAQGSEGLLDLNLELGLGQSVELGVDLGLGSLGIDPTELDPIEFPELTGSLANLEGAGSEELSSGSEDLEGVIGEITEAGSAGGNGSSSQGSNGSSSADEGTEESGNNGSSQGSNNGNGGQLSSGSLTPNPGTGSDEDEDEDEDENEDVNEPGLFGSLEDIFTGSSEAGSDNGSGSDEGTDEDEDAPGGDEDEDAGNDTVVNSAELDSGVLLAVGSLAAGGIAVGLAAQGGINLPPLPEVNLGFVCQLPQEGIDFLKNNGSMERDECEPEDQQN